MSDPKILLADDNATNTMIVKLAFEAMGLPVTCVENAQLAVDAAGREIFDLILMDVQMPVMDGHAAIRQIRSTEMARNRKAARIYTVTTDSEPEDVRASLDAGADGHITKPFRLGVLYEALATTHTDGAGDPAE